MKARVLIVILLIFLTSTINIQGQSSSDTIKKKTEKKYQAKAPKTQAFGAEAFKPSDKTTLRWLGMGG